MLTASIMVRRGITKGSDILYFMEDDLRFQHSPFSFTMMEEALDRILDAIEEKEKILIFGDRDVDGVTATTLLYDCLTDMGGNVSYRLPTGDDAYGLSMVAVDDFSKEEGSLIITVDCGISNNNEIAHAGDLGIDVIVLDHHNPPSDLPGPAIIIDPKLSDSGYPFPDISGCAVVYKVVSALRFSHSKWYKTDAALLDIKEEEGGFCIDCVKIRNLVPTGKISEHVAAGKGLEETRLPTYLKSSLILVWDADRVKKMLTLAFGSGTDFNLLDIRPLTAAFFPTLANLGLDKIKTMSKIARYGNHEPTEIGGFYNIYVTYAQTALRHEFPKMIKQEDNDMQLVALAALADIMPMQNENRIFVKRALKLINSKEIRPGLFELMTRLNLLTKKVNSTDLSWQVISNLNAAGRLGHPELAAELFISKEAETRDEVAKKIIELNSERKQLTLDAWSYVAIQAKTSIPVHNNKLCVVIDERINRGVCGILAGRLLASYDLPAIVVTFVGQNAIGSMRSCRGLDATKFLDKMASVFLNHGGHTAAAGFSLERSRLEEFEQLLKDFSKEIELSESTSNTFEIDAEIPPSLLTPTLLNTEDRFEPFGEANPPLSFMTKSLPITDAMVMDKGEKLHLKLTLDSGKYKWPALFWSQGERLHRDFEVGDKIDLIYHVERNTFRGNETPQLIISDIKKE